MSSPRKHSCTTHHWACDCREAAFAELDKTNTVLATALSEIKDCTDNSKRLVGASGIDKILAGVDANLAELDTEVGDVMTRLDTPREFAQLEAMKQAIAMPVGMVPKAALNVYQKGELCQAPEEPLPSQTAGELSMQREKLTACAVDVLNKLLAEAPATVSELMMHTEYCRVGNLPVEPPITYNESVPVTVLHVLNWVLAAAGNGLITCDINESGWVESFCRITPENKDNK